MATAFQTPYQSQVGLPGAPESDLRNIFGVLRRRWLTIFAVAITTAGLAALVALQLTPRYIATSSVAVQSQKTQVVDIQDVLSDMAPDAATMETQAAILRSRSLASKLVDRLNLADDPEFNPEVDRGLNSFSLFRPASWFADTAGKPLPKTAEELARERVRVTSAVAGSLSIALIPRSYLITITATSRHPAKAARLANTLAELYISDQIEAKYDATRRASSYLESRVEELRGQALAADRAAELYRAQSGLVGGTNGGIASQQLSEVNSELILVRSERAAKEAQLGQIRKLVASGGGSLETSAAIVDSPLIQRLREQESEVVRKLAELQGTYGERHPRIINATAELRDLRGKIGEEVRKIASATANEVAVARAREQALLSSLNAVESRLGQSGQAEVRLRELQRQAESAKALYETFLNRYKETRQQVDVQTADARIVSQADVPVAPAYPRKSLIVVLALMAGLLGGVALVVVIEQLDNTVRGAEAIERLGGGSVLTFVPVVKQKLERPEDIVTLKPQAMVAEAIRTLRGALTLTNVDQPPKVVMLTSSVPAEGKTFISIGLARVASQSGQRVIIVDADMRHPRVHKAIGLENDQGLVQVLSGTNELAQIIKTDPMAGIDVLTAGVGAPNPADLMRSQRMAQLLDLLRQHYDLVVIDTPPFVPMTDSQNVARLVDKVVLVVRWGETPLPVVANTLKQMHKLNVPLAGSVLSQVDMTLHSKYGYGDYGYHYAKYGGYYGAEA